MSRSILKTSDASRRGVPVHVSEGPQEDFVANVPVKPWCPIDDEPPLANHVHHDMDTIQRNLQKMHEKMMNNFPPPAAPPSPFPSLGPPPPPMFEPLRPLQPLPLPLAAPDQLSSSPRNGRLDNGSPYGSLQAICPPDAGPLCLTSPKLQVANPGGFPPTPNNMLMTPPHLLPPMPLAPAPSPIIKEDESGYRILELVLDVKGYLPEDIHISTEGKVLFIHACRLAAKHDVSTGEGRVHDARVAKECRRQYTLPEIVRAENLRCFVNQKGELVIEGALGPDVVRTLTKKKVKFAAGRH